MSGRDDGSIFVESLVAVAVLAMILSATLQVARDGARRTAGAEARREALMVARSQLDAVGSAIPLRPGEAEGRDGDLGWRVLTTSCGGSDAGVLYCVRAEVAPAAGGAPLASLETRRFGSSA